MKQVFYKEGYKYQLTRDFVISVAPICAEHEVQTDWLRLSDKGLLLIKAGYAWDGASGPTFDTKSAMRGPLVHDALYQLMRLGHLDRKWKGTADELLYKMLLEDGMWSVRAYFWKRELGKFGAAATEADSEPEELVAP